jgi:hypothetical protein
MAAMVAGSIPAPARSDVIASVVAGFSMLFLCGSSREIS